jgi:hypothetical protein
MKAVLAAVLASFALTSCDANGSKKPEDARGDTNVRFIVCITTGCYVTARFKHLDSCLRFKQLDALKCRETDRPGELVCRESADPSGPTYCTQ